MERYICIHGHFYQPPRENAWLEYVEQQDSAYPYHDWNERVTAECYEPNSASRILDREGWITRIVNNYAKISFNFGPTLLAWMERNTPEVYEAVLAFDKESARNFFGHGSALAQAYNHMIMPLANSRDKYTQVRWGLQDFKHRFGREPEGMWLPETAVDLETLDIMAELGIRFTILAPHQAKRIRKIGSKVWEDVTGERIDLMRAYEAHLASGRKIGVFFYDDPIARAVAFEGLLRSGKDFADRLTSAFSNKPAWPQLVHIATDGETYGHHHKFGEMALSFALHYIESNKLARITNYSEYLEKHPPTHEVEILENTSWSCVHGVERWRSDCGDNTGHPGWNQKWRAPLRQAMDCLRDTMAPQFEEKAREFLKDPWAARNDYIDVILDRSPENVQRFLSKQATKELDDTEKITALKLLELQRHAMLMFTSCGWFFDDLSEIGTIQVIQYAGRVVQLSEEIFSDEIESRFLELLEPAKSNIPEVGNGRQIYEKYVRPAMVDLTRVAAHYAINSLFEEYGEQAKVYSYFVDLEDYQSYVAGAPRLVVGRAKVTSEITGESAVLNFGVLYFGDHSLNAGVCRYEGEEAYQKMVEEITGAFSAADFPKVVRLLDKHFGVSTFSLKSLFRDEQLRVLEPIVESAVTEVESVYRDFYERHYPLMRFLLELGYPLPKPFQVANEFILSTELRWALSGETLDIEHIKNLLDEAKTWQAQLDTEGLGYLFRQTLEDMTTRFTSSIEEVSLLTDLLEAVKLAKTMPFEVNLRKVQNLYYEVLQNIYPVLTKKSGEGDKKAQEWVDQFVALGKELKIRVS